MYEEFSFMHSTQSQLDPACMHSMLLFHAAKCLNAAPGSSRDAGSNEGPHQTKQFHVGLYLGWDKRAAGRKKEEKRDGERKSPTQIYMGDDITTGKR